MYKIIIVDDDEEVREGILECIDWASHGFRVAGDCRDGMEALQAVEEHQPDLVLSDICMPYIDGIELTRRIQEISAHTKVIILTGYDDFEYAQQALRLKVHDFIVKPITAAELRAMLDKVKLELDRESVSRSRLQQLSSKVHQSLPLLKERFLERMMSEALSEDEIRANLLDFGLPPIRPPFVVLTIDLDDLDMLREKCWRSDPELPLFAVCNVASDVAGGERAIVFRTRSETVAVLLFEGAEQQLREAAFRMSDGIRRCAETFLKFTVTVGIGSSCESLRELPRAYRSSVAAVEYRFALGKNRVIDIREMENAGKSPSLPNDEWSSRFTALLKTGSPQDADTLVGQFISELRSSLLPPDACYLHIQTVVIVVMNTLRELADTPSPFSYHEKTLADMYRFTTLHEIEHWLRDLIADAISRLTEQRGDIARSQVRSAIAYIEEHYADEHFSMQELCRHVHLSKSYLSAIFKQQTEHTVMEYATRLRIEKAKELLLTPLKSYEAAAKAGYSDPQYFSVIFKKHTGESPTEYRDRMTKVKL